MQIELLPHQYAFMRLREKYGLLLGGIGSGKTFAGALWTTLTSQQYPDALGFIGANTYKQLQNSTLSALFGFLDDSRIPFDYNKNTGMLDVNGAKLICASLEKYNFLRGIEIGYGWLDETRDTRIEAYQMLQGRLRDNNGPLQLRLTSTGNGFDYMYEYFAGDRKTAESVMVNAKSQDNFHLPEGYVESLLQQYDEKTAKQEIGGEFINVVSGQICYAFNRKDHVKDIKYNPNFPIYVGTDFNINPMTSVVSQIYNDTVHVIDEVYLMGSNTHELGNEIKKRYGTRNVNIIPDFTGKRKSTSSSGLSDHIILQNMGFNIISRANPFRLDRYNAVNNAFDKMKCIISEKCVKLIRDLEQLSYKEGSNLPDTSYDSTLGHLFDCIGYIIWFAMPIKKPKQISRMIER